jgi:group I intron endonuclease
MTGIYKIQSKTKPERIYIGSAKDIQRRFRRHKNELKSNYHANEKLQRHANKYGVEDLSFIILESIVFTCNVDLLAKEQKYLDKIKPYFNICKIAGNLGGFKRNEKWRNNMSKGMKGKKKSITYPCSDEKKLKISQGNKGKKVSEETRIKMSASHKGVPRPYRVGKKLKPLSEEHKRKIIEANKGNKYTLGRKQTEEAKEKLSKFFKGRKMSDEFRQKIKESWVIRKQNKHGTAAA